MLLLISAEASTPVAVKLTEVTRPIGTPRRVTSWLANSPPDSRKSTLTAIVDRAGLMPSDPTAM